MISMDFWMMWVWYLYKKFSGAKNVSANHNDTVSGTVSKLSGNKTYYVRIRTFYTSHGKKYYSDWSDVKTVKTKK